MANWVALCWFNRHHPDRRQVEWDGKSYVGTCRHCGSPIRRKKRGIWQRDREAG